MKSLTKSERKLLENIKSFDKRPFTTTELRDLNGTHNLKQRLCQLKMKGMIEHINIIPTTNPGIFVDVWRELHIVIPAIPKPVPSPRIRTHKPKDNLPGWRAICPTLFADMAYPWFPGGRLRTHVERW